MEYVLPSELLNQVVFGSFPFFVVFNDLPPNENSDSRYAHYQNEDGYSNSPLPGGKYAVDWVRHVQERLIPAIQSGKRESTDESEKTDQKDSPDSIVDKDHGGGE